MIDCPSRKIIYYSEKEAKESLIMLHVKYQNSSTRTFYTCDQCGYFHLTFLGEIDDTLKQAEQVGRIDQFREADYWIRKLH